MKTQNKENLRSFFRTKRREISGSEREKFSETITNSLSEIFLENLQNIFSEYVALFAGTEEEPEVLELIKLFPDQKFCFPKISGTREMDFFEVQKISDLEVGKFGILEPKKTCRHVDPEKIKLFCIPAIAIDFSGNRLGMGGGFYDTYLSKISTSLDSISTIGVIFSCQFSKNSFSGISEAFDIPVNMIVSEKTITKI